MLKDFYGRVRGKNVKCGVKNTFNLIENKLEKVKNPAKSFSHAQHPLQ